MTEQEKQELSKAVASKYGVSSFLRHWHGYPVYEGEDIWLHDDSARCFDLMVDNMLDIEMLNDIVICFNYSSKTREKYAYHPTKQESTRIAILKALLAKE